MGALGEALDLHRVLQLLPFFVLGLTVRREQQELLHRPAVRVAAIAVLALGAALVATAALLALVPRRRTPLTALGEGTMHAYLPHGFAVKGAVFAGVYAHLHSPAGFAAVTAAASALALILCTRPVRRAFSWAVEPELRWAFRDHDRRALPELELEGPDRRPTLLGSPASL